TADIKQWFNDNITDDLFDELKNDDITEEVLYFKRTEIIRSKLNEAYPGLDDDFVDAMIDDFYDIKFPSEAPDEESSDDDASSDESSDDESSNE
ncbi:MAG: hypothetical protein J5824_00970, partial [Lachnospiraceae bacterium]|nr:hypothetical protein [Lachnospiraceae bacterium]